MRFNSKDTIRIVLLLVLASYVIFLRLGNLDIVTSNEGQRSTPPIEMIRSGDYIIPTINYKPYLSKPPLIYWMVLISYRVTGVINPWSARLPMALSGVVLVILFYLIIKQFFEQGIALIAALMLLTSPYVLVKMRRCEIDLALTLALFLAVYFLYKYCYPRESKTYHSALLSGFFLGLATMLKGPVALIFYLVAIVSLLVIDKSNLKKLFACNGLLIIGVFILTAFPWYLTLIKRIGIENGWNILQGQALRRVYKASEINSGSIFFYLLRVPVALAPWGLLLPLTLRREYFKKGTTSSFLKFALLYFYFGIVVLSLIKGKETEYALPLMPFAIVVVAFLFNEFLSGRLTRFQAIYIRCWFWVSLSALIIGGLYFMVTYIVTPILLPNFFHVTLSLAPIIVLTFLMIAYHGKKKFLNSIMYLIGISALLFILHSGIEINKKNNSQSLKLIGESARELMDKNYRVEVFKKGRPQLMFYLSRKINVIDGLKNVKTRLDEAVPYFIIMQNEDFQKLKGITQKDVYLYTKAVSKRDFVIVSNINTEQP